MKRRSALLFVLLACSFAHRAAADCMPNGSGKMVCGPPESSCMQDRYREVVCSPSGGGIALDRYQNPVCGAGACVRDVRGDIHCSRTARGSAAIDMNAAAACTDGCAPASAAMCVKPAPSN
ncbi:hypothetical protein FN976_14150 [Caenimonas sedimenti]|uniref:Uncharacterized protein n=1 Tax=Caenimonas sedimenti TaxID=2596921 RepID=A0A562ZRA6_9BURK|nr:hypothetical protein [Caenimonas sedimenti]TWO70694.1 hypothetical protein FN976_14150 [Caenimonas sedimenti]